MDNSDQPLTDPIPLATATATSTPIEANAKVSNPMKRSLIIYGLLEAIVFLGFSQLIFPIFELQNSFGSVKPTTYLGFFYFFLSIFIALLQIIIGLFSLEHKMGEKWTRWLYVSGFVMVALMIPAVFIFNIYPIYDLTNQFK